jgi:hypothetical protein
VEIKTLRGHFSWKLDGGFAPLRGVEQDFRMSASDYHFVTRWTLPASPTEIDAVLSDTSRVAAWWPELYRSIRIVAHGNERGVGKTVDVVTKGFLPYELHWTYRVTEAVPGKGFSIEASGDLEGSGRWTFEEQKSGTTLVTYDWRVRAEKPLLRYFSFFLRPLFSWNHNYVMQEGEVGIRTELQRRR